MCMSCVSQADALFWNGAIVGSVALGGLGRVRAAIGGRSAERKERAEQETRQFLSSLGLDPDEVLVTP